jgi:GNAT superfamily N-acetyltransferase
MERIGHRLRRVDSTADWMAYHDIRRAELFACAPASDYDVDHPDEHEPSNLPHVLDLDGQVIGTIRIDLLGSARVAFRLVAIRGACQRLGHGSALLRLAEALVDDLGYSQVTVNASATVLPFFMRHGYAPGDWHDIDRPPAGAIRLGKKLRLDWNGSLYGELMHRWLAAGGP